MPILWRYLLRSYFKVLALCVVAFISVLLITRFQDIARFASSGVPKMLTIAFTLSQIPYILPIAIPVSCLIAAMLLFRDLSHTHELTALRAAGLGIQTLIFPLIFAGTLLSLLNFLVASEIAPRCRSFSKKLVYEMTALNPLVLLQKDTMVKLKDAYVDMKVLHSGKYAKDVIVIINDRSHQRLGLMAAGELSLKGDMLTGNLVTFISSVDSKRTEGFDHLVIENQQRMSTKASNLSQFIQGNDWHGGLDYLPLRMILAKKATDRHRHLKGFGRSDVEICRRFSLALAAFTFTFIGIAFGMEISRNQTKKGIFWAIGLSAFFMICFIGAKSWRYNPIIPGLIYLLPHPLIILLSLRSLKRVSAGGE